MESKKLNEQELQTLREIQQSNQNLIQELGSISIAKMQTESREKNALEFREQLIAKETEFKKEITEKYGDVSINLADGVITPVEKNEE
jgi:hypothetical protein